jgi:hypothetical protein
MRARPQAPMRGQIRGERGCDTAVRCTKSLRGIISTLGEAAQSDELGRLPAFAPKRLATTTLFFRGLVVMPLLLRALYGETLKVLHGEIEPHVARSVAFFLAACRHDGVN